jgi:hypothetical protein
VNKQLLASSTLRNVAKFSNTSSRELVARMLHRLHVNRESQFKARSTNEYVTPWTCAPPSGVCRMPANASDVPPCALRAIMGLGDRHDGEYRVY